MKENMTSNQYKKICECCDSLLLSNETSDERVAINWLHVIREHPICLKEYKNLLHPVGLYQKIKLYFLQDIYNIIRFIYYLTSVFFSTQKKSQISSHIPNKCDILFVSHLLNEKHLDNDKDFYFGDLPDKLSKFNITSIVSLINHIEKYDKKSGKELTDEKSARIVLGRKLGFVDEVSIFYKQFREYLRLRRHERKVDGLLKLVTSRARQESITLRTHSTMIIATQIGNLIRKYNPKMVITTYEGHSWERLVFSVARKVSPNIQCIGYQHAAIYQLQHSIRRKLAKQYNPNQILTSGEVSTRLLEESKGLKGIKISLLGSCRHVVGLVKDYKRINTLKKCLVLPEGHIDECRFLFKFSLDCALKLPNVQFIWRLHPQINFSQIIRDNNKFKNLPDNIMLSSNSLEKDIQASSCVLYRGSTAVIQSIVSGLRPFYVRNKNEMSIDPLYELENGCDTVESTDDFIRAFYDNGFNHNDMKSVIRYCQKFFTPLDASVLVNIITDRDL